MTNRDVINQKMAEAQANPGVPVDIGRVVLCDWCDLDFTESKAAGGFIFHSNATCPSCAPKMMKDVKAYGEEHLIRATCPEGMAFADFVRGYRQARGSNAIVVRNTLPGIHE